jgi:hypothetical protein
VTCLKSRRLSLGKEVRGTVSFMALGVGWGVIRE